MFAIPLILAGIVFLNALGSKGFWTVSTVLIVFGWPTMLRLMRSSVLSVRSGLHRRRPGARCQRLAHHHQTRPPQRDHTGHRLRDHHRGVIISAEASLSFLNVGLQLPAISWG